MTPSRTERNKVFISYRRYDAVALAGRLAERLQAYFGEDYVFFDTTSTPPGERFPERLRMELGRARVVLVVMGTAWVGVDDWGKRRIDEAHDWVRMEVRSALASPSVTVIPVLADGQDRLPPKEALPSDIAQLSNCNLVSIKSSTFDRDVQPLLRRLEDIGFAHAASSLRSQVSVPLIVAPQPNYRTRRAQEFSERLQDLLRRREVVSAEGGRTDSLDAEILQTRRLLRNGAPEPGWELGDGRFVLLDELGHGGFATVWKAREQDARNSSMHPRLVAIKVIHAHLAGDPVRVDRFFRGARIMAELRHPNIVRVLEARCEDHGYLYFVMELIEGGNFRTAVQRGHVQPADAIATILAIGEALAAAHRLDYVHRDVKPANILLTREREPKLSDFDLVGAADTTGGTGTGALGTYVYSSPECLTRPQDAGPASDVYSLAMTLVFALTGEDPNPVTMDRTYRDVPCSDPIKQILRRATSVRAEDRYPTATEFVAALRLAVGDADAPKVKVSASNPNLETVRRSFPTLMPRRWILVTIAVTLFGLAALGTRWLQRAPSRALVGKANTVGLPPQVTKADRDGALSPASPPRPTLAWQHAEKAPLLPPSNDSPQRADNMGQGPSRQGAPAQAVADNLLLGSAKGLTRQSGKTEKVRRSTNERAFVSASGMCTLTQSDILSAMLAVRADVQVCASKHGAFGTVMTEIFVGRGGKVDRVRVTGRFAGTPTASCVATAAKLATFRPCEPMAFPWPFTLAAR